MIGGTEVRIEVWLLLILISSPLPSSFSSVVGWGGGCRYGEEDNLSLSTEWGYDLLLKSFCSSLANADWPSMPSVWLVSKFDSLMRHIWVLWRSLLLHGSLLWEMLLWLSLFHSDPVLVLATYDQPTVSYRSDPQAWVSYLCW